MTNERRMWVTEVHNFGGFFGGDTVTLTAVPWPTGEEETLTIDEKALDNVQDRHTIAPDMLLDLRFAGERIDHAELVGARELEPLRHALGTQPSAAYLDAPRIRLYQCERCNVWIVGQPEIHQDVLICRICRQPLG